MQQNSPKQIESRFKNFQTIAIWAGIFGVVQSVIWIALSITGILFYMCAVQYESDQTVNFGNVIGLIIHRLYFYSAECGNFPNIQLPTELHLTPSQIHIWIWVYLVVSVFWFFSSFSLISLSLITTTDINNKQWKRKNSLLYLWIFIVLSLSAMDLGLGIIFGLDSNTFHSKTSALQFPKDANNNETGIKNLAGEISALSMMIIAMRGFILWILNIGMMLVLYKETFAIYEPQTEQSNIVNQDYTNAVHPILTRPPVRAYDTRNEAVVARPIDNPNRAPSPISSLDAAAIERASKLSNAVLMSRKSRFANYEQYPPDNNNSSPAPDYSPRVQSNENPFVKRENTNSFLKNQRYQSYLYNNNN